MVFPTDGQNPALVIITLICGGMAAQAIHVMAELGLADLVKEEPQTTAQLAQTTGTDAANLARLLRALVSVGLLSEPTAGSYGSTSLSSCLESTRPGSLYPMARMAGSDWQWRVLAGLPESLKTGQPAIEHILGKDLWSYFRDDDPEGGRCFNQAINQSVGPSDEALATAYDFSSVNTLVDVGGGLGSFLLTVLPRYPSLTGVLFDRAEVIAQAKERIAQAGLIKRCDVVEGDFFQAVPAGGDAYFLRQIIKDWNDEQSTRILQNCMHAMNQGGKILVAEQVLRPGQADLIGKLTDLQLMTTLPGRERDEQEFRRLFAAAGLTLSRMVATPSLYRLLEAEVV